MVSRRIEQIAKEACSEIAPTRDHRGRTRADSEKKESRHKFGVSKLKLIMNKIIIHWLIKVPHRSKQSVLQKVPNG